MSSQKALAVSLLYAFGLKQPASGWSQFYLYALLGIDFVLTLSRIPILCFMIRDWFRRESSIKTTFFAFLFTWILIDLPRIGLYTGPMLFSGNGIDRIMNLLLIASYFDIYHLYAKSVSLVAFSWNRFSILGFGQSSAFNSEKNGPTCFLLVLMPLLPTVITNTVPPAYNPAPIFVYACLALSAFFLFCTIFGAILRGFRFLPEKVGIEFRLFPTIA
uniref:Uncharacterized protein n=1 Tax=Panagrolaimus davidi TaxID=227884 RepID=A0A914Q2W1_9BILA